MFATNAHVVCGNERGYLKKCSKHTKYNIVTPDGKSHAATGTAVKLLPDLDLAIVQFQSDRNYPVATLGDSDNIKIDAPIYAAGFPSKKGFNFNSGSIVASVKNRLKGDNGKYVDNGGYTVIYDAATYPGMSGGGVFARQGQLIAIHGNGDKYPKGSQTNIGSDRFAADFNAEFGKLSDALTEQKLGINRGIPINYLRQESIELMRSAPRISTNKSFEPTTANDWFILAINKTLYVEYTEENAEPERQDKREAIEYCTKAIQIKPDYFMAYYLRGRLWTRLDVGDKALADYHKASAIAPTSTFKYLVRSDARSRTDDLKGALTDVNKAIELNPNYALAYAARSGMYSRINKPSMVLADLNRAIALDPDNHQYIFARAATKLSTSDPQGAKQDADLAIVTANRAGDVDYADIYQKYLDLATTQYSQSRSTGKKINPNIVISPNADMVEFYLVRANQKKSKGDLQGALADYNKAVELQPTVLVLLSRAGFKEKELKDFAGAEADLSRVIELRSDDPTYYLFRVNLRRLNNNRNGAIADLQQAAKLYKQRGDDKNHAFMQQLIQYFPSN
ncbi:serine protease [Chamaesiphon polymorphus]|uniref:serine protease n=1 Tax=Chamaesiphon polymorphus TaxID=2107691 RepID=UPI0024820324|nr:serine protease [Chamaesiphon polymorphus]